MKLKLLPAVLGLLAFSPNFIVADTLELKNGSVIKGTYVGGTESQISFKVGSSVQQYATADITSLRFDSREVAGAAGSAAAPSSADRANSAPAHDINSSASAGTPASAATSERPSMASEKPAPVLVSRSAAKESPAISLPAR